GPGPPDVAPVREPAEEGQPQRWHARPAARLSGKISRSGGPIPPAGRPHGPDLPEMGGPCDVSRAGETLRCRAGGARPAPGTRGEWGPGPEHGHSPHAGFRLARPWPPKQSGTWIDFAVHF